MTTSNPTPPEVSPIQTGASDIAAKKAAVSVDTPAAAAPAGFALPPPTFPLPASASLYVGELHPDVNEAILFELFNQVGPVASVRVCRDAITRRSLGYGYVNFHNVTDGERALDALNYHALKGTPIRIMWSQRDPSLRRSGAGNVFIKNLEKSIDNKALHDTFSTFGNILSCKVVVDEHGQSRGFGFVHFETAEAAQLAIEKVNGMLLNDVQVFVGPHVSRRERVSKIEEARARFTNVYIKNLDSAYTEAQLRDLFAPFGDITSAMIQRDEAGSSRGFGFVNFASHSAAAAAVDALNETDILGKTIIVCRAQSKAEREDELRRQYEAAKLERLSKFQGVNLYVKNIEESVDENELRELFAPHGTLHSLKLMRDERGVSRGFGFVCFSSPEEAQKALADLNGKMVKEKPIFVAFAQRKEDRQTFLAAQYHQRMQYRQYLAAQQNAAVALGAPPSMYPGGPFPGSQGRPAHLPQGAPQMQQSFQRRPPQGMGPQSQSGGDYNSGSFVPRFRQGMHQGGGHGFRPGSGGQRPFYQQQQQHPMNAGARYGMMQPVGPQGFQRRPPPPFPMGFRGNQGGPLGRRFYGGNPGAHFNAPGSAEFYNVGQAGAAGLSPSYLANLPLEAQKQLLGERLYPLVLQKEPLLAQKITGMLLEMDNGELLHLLESPDTLALKVSEAAATAAAATDAPESVSESVASATPLSTSQ